MRRREVLRALTALACMPGGVGRASEPVLRRPIPSTGELVPVIGLGTWLTFDAGADAERRAGLVPVLRAFFDGGGALIDSSPMYGSAEAVLGDLLPRVRGDRPLFAATKVWTRGRQAGIRQMETSLGLWRVPRFDLMQVHNLLDWETHLGTLAAWKAQGRVRYIGVTTSHGLRQAETERVLAQESVDFVQLTYSLADRSAEQRLLPLARERGVAVLANRPFDGGDLFARLRGKPLPGWAREIDCASWAQVFLKFIVSHPAVTCAIQATSNPKHAADNMGAGFGRLPDAALRRRIAQDAGAA